MIDTFILCFPISAIEANYLVTNLSGSEYFTPTATGIKTNSFIKFGILDLNIWINREKLITSSFTEENCLINATIHYQYARNSFITDYTPVTKQDDEKAINSYLYNALCKKIASILKLADSCIDTSPTPPQTTADYTANGNKPEKIPARKVLYGFNREIKWKIKSVTFIYNFVGTELQTYYYLLSGGYNLNKYKLEKTLTIDHAPKAANIDKIYKTEYTGIHRKSESNQNDSFHITVQWNKGAENCDQNITDYPIAYVPDVFIPKENRLQIKFSLYKNKILALCKEYNIQERYFKQFMNHADTIDKNLFSHYTGLIIGKAYIKEEEKNPSNPPQNNIRFYKCKQAEKIIDKSSFTRKQKSKMLDVLKSVASYKGISNYLEHVEDTYPPFQCMYSVRKKAYALKILRDIQSLGICPLNIPVKAKYKELENPITVFLNNPYMVTSTDSDTAEK